MNEPRAEPASAPVPVYEAIYFVLGAIFVTSLLLTNILGTKLIHAFPAWLPTGFFGDGPVTLSASIIIYPVTFLVTDITSEIYGRRRADLLVYAGFAMSLLMLVLVQITIALPPSPVWLSDAGRALGIMDIQQLQDAFTAVFYFPGKLLFASMLAYLTAQLLDNRLFHFWKWVTSGKALWLRNNASTACSQLVDTIIVNSIFLRWAFGLEWSVIGQIIVASYVFKLCLALIDTPFIYLGVFWIRRMLRKADEPEAAHAISVLTDSHVPEPAE